MNRNFFYVMAGLVLGVALGVMCYYAFPDKATAAEVARYMSLVSTVFLKLIKMIIGPLVLSTLIVGIGHMGDAASVGRVGAKTMAWFVTASIVSLLLGLAMVDLLQPGVGIVVDQGANAANLTTQTFSIENFIDHLVPTSIFKSLADGEILQIVVFSVFAGVAIMALGERGKPLLELADGVAHMMLNITAYVMKLAPFAVCAAVASVITKSGPAVLLNFAKFLGGFYLTLLILWVLLIVAGRIVIGPRMGELISRMREPFLLAFSTASSEASYPKILEQLQLFGVSRRIASFVLPLGYSFNLDGTMAYTTFASMFIAQAYGVDMPLEQTADHGGGADDHLEGRRRRAARLAGGDPGDAQAVRHSGGRAAADPRHRPVPRHGPQRHQRDRQLARRGGGGQIRGRSHGIARRPSRTPSRRSHEGARCLRWR